MSRHISIFFDQVKWNRFVLVFAAKFKEKFAKFFIEADLDLISAPAAPPGRMVQADIGPDLFPVSLRRVPIDAFFCGIVDLVAKRLCRGCLETDKMVLDAGVVKERIGIGMTDAACARDRPR